MSKAEELIPLVEHLSERDLEWKKKVTKSASFVSSSSSDECSDSESMSKTSAPPTVPQKRKADTVEATPQKRQATIAQRQKLQVLAAKHKKK